MSARLRFLWDRMRRPQICLEKIDGLSQRITELDAQIAAASRRSRFFMRLQKMPGIGPTSRWPWLPLLPRWTTSVGAVTFCLAGACAQTAFQRRQAKARAQEQVWAARHPAASDHRRNGSDIRSQGAAPCREFLAGPYRGSQAEDAEGDCSGKQDGPHIVGHDHQG